MNSNHKVTKRNLNLQRLDRYLKNIEGNNLCAIFDIGTKTGKLLVANKENPLSNWTNSTFFNAGQIFDLGFDYSQFDEELKIGQSQEALKNIISFINQYKARFIQAGMNIDDIHATGSGVFRWMINRKDILGLIEDQTGIKITVLDPIDECFLSFLPIIHAYNYSVRGGNKPKKFKECDVILLFDQGGASTIISYFYPVDLAMGNHHLITELGSIKLDQKFFGSGIEKECDPEINKINTLQQFERISKYIKQKIDNWVGFPEIQRKGKVIHTFGKGTNLLNTVEGYNSFAKHNRVITTEDLKNKVEWNCKYFGQKKYLYVKDLHNARDVTDVNLKFLPLIGLPVYKRLLEKFNQNSLRYIAFGPRYGVFLALYFYRLKLDKLHTKLLTYTLKKSNHCEPPFEAYQGEEDYIFVSYAHKDKSIVFNEIQLLNQAGFRIWYDEGIQPGTHWDDEIAKAIQKAFYFISFISPKAIQSKNVTDEIKYALKNKKPFLAIHIEETDLPLGLDMRMNHIQSILKYEMSPSQFQKKLPGALVKNCPECVDWKIVS